MVFFLQFSVISYLNESHSDVVFGPCRRDISIAVEELRMPYICTTFDPEAEGFKFKILPALSDFIEAMGGLVYGQYRRGGDEEYKTIIYEGNKGTQQSITQWNVIALKSQIGFLWSVQIFFYIETSLFVWLQHEKPIKQTYLNLNIKKKTPLSLWLCIEA